MAHPYAATASHTPRVYKDVENLFNALAKFDV